MIGHLLRDAIDGRGPTSVEFTITPAMVSRFAEFTGDRSSLHVSDTFARRSAYRQPVVHGMLPVAFLAAVPGVAIAGFRAVPLGLSGRFTAPVFPGESLTVIADAGRISADGAQVDIEYRISRDTTMVTAGVLTLGYEPRAAEREETAPAPPSLLTSNLEVNHFTLEQLEPGTADRLNFMVPARCGSLLARILNDGLPAGHAVDPSTLNEQFYVPNLLSVLLYSTSIGVSLPGAAATFLEFSHRVEQRIERGVNYALSGRVVHRSSATRIVKKELTVTRTEGGGVAARGKAAALVAKPFTAMPSIEEVRAAGLDFGLAGKVVLITGASRGIGETTAKLFALHGAKVVVNYHRGADDAARVVREIESAGGEAIAVSGDVSNPAEVKALVQGSRERFGAVHVLVNNAARDFRPIPFLRLGWDEVQKDIDVIVKGAFLCSQEVLPLMLEQGEGRIVNISTIATDSPPADQTKYVIAKSALVGLTRSLSVEFAPHNIFVNLVVPNFVETDLVAHIPDGFRQKIAREIPVQRAGSPLDVARAAVFLASRYSSFTTGQKLMVTGGAVPFL